MKGNIKGDPFASTDNYSGELGYFCILEIYAIMQLFQSPFISIDELKENIPSFNWYKGDNGVVLDTEIAEQLDELFNRLYHSELGSEWGYIVEKQSQRVIEYAAIKDIHNLDLWGYIFSSQFQKDDTHFCENSSIKIDYLKKEAKLEIEFYKGYGLSLTCNNILKINLSCDLADPELSNFFIYREDDNHLHLVSNGIEIICKTISFDRVLE